MIGAGTFPHHPLRALGPMMFGMRPMFSLPGVLLMAALGKIQIVFSITISSK